MKTMYRRLFSHLPREIRIPFLHWKARGEFPKLNPPLTLSDKLCWRKIYLFQNPNSQDLLSKTSDKVLCRDYVAAKIGSNYLTQNFYSAKNSRNLPFDQLPDKFMLKASHGSTWVHLVPNKQTEDFNKLHNLCDMWLKMSWGELAGEWWYSMNSPSILVEEYLEDNLGNPPFDYKFFVMRGKVSMIQVDIDRAQNHRRNLYTPDWNKLSSTLAYANGRDIAKPCNLNLMLDIASKLGEDFDFVRVDLYSVEDRIVFGELTHCPGSGWEKFSNPALDLFLGQQIAFP